MSNFEPYDPEKHGIPVGIRSNALHDELFEALHVGPQVVEINRSSLYQAAEIRGVRVSYRTLPDGRLLVRLAKANKEAPDA